MKKLFIGALIALTTISFVACGNDTQSSNNSATTNNTVTTEAVQEDNSKAEEEAEAKAKAEKEAEAKEKAEKEVKEKAEAEKKAKEEEDAFNATVNLIEETCQDNGFTYINVTGDYSTKTIHVNVGMDGVAQDMVLVKATGINMDAYYSLEDTVTTTCKKMHDTFGYHIAYNVVNDANPDNVMLSVLDGSVIYSYMNE